MKRSSAWSLAAALAVALIAPSAAQAISDKDCQRPRPPEVPRADEASDIDMISARQRIKMFLEASQTFLACLDQAAADVGTAARQVKLNRIQKKREEIQGEMTSVTEEFNQQIRRFKERTEGSDADPAKSDPGRPEASEETASRDPAPAGGRDAVVPDPPPVPPRAPGPEIPDY